MEKFTDDRRGSRYLAGRIEHPLIPDHAQADVLTTLLADYAGPGSDDVIIESLKMFSFMHYVPRQSSMLVPFWQSLGEVLSTASPATATTEELQRSVRAFVLVEALSHQTGLPFTRRSLLTGPEWNQRKASFTKKRLVDELSAMDLAETNTDYQNTAHASDTFKEKIASLLTTPPQTDEQIVDYIIRETWVENTIARGYASDMWDDLASPQSQQWIKDLFSESRGIAIGNQRFAALLLDGKFPVVSQITTWFVWRAGWLHHPDRVEDLVKYFKQNLDTDNFIQATWNMIRGEKWSWLPVYLNPESYTADPEVFGDFLRTIPFEDFTSEDQKRFIRKLLVFAGMAKTQSADHPATAFITGKVKELVDQMRSPGAFAQELAVLADAKPGILYVNPAGEARARSGPAGAAEVNKVYVSKAQLVEDKTVLIRQPAEVKAVGVGVDGTGQSIVWGEVGIVNKDLVKLLQVLEEKLAAAGVDQDKALTALVDYTPKVYSTKPVVVMPAFIRETPLAVLANLGIVGIEQKGSDVTIVIDPQAAGLECSTGKIAIQGTMDREYLHLDQADPGFENSALNTLLAATVLFGKGQFIDYALSREELRELRSSLKSYNARAKSDGGVQLRFDEDPQKRDSDLPLTVISTGQKLVVLSLGK